MRFHARHNKGVPGARGTERQHLEMLARQGDKRALAELESGPEFPEGLEYLYRWFLELAQRREYDMNGPRPITWQALQAWAQLTNREPTPSEVSALCQIDVATLNPGEPEPVTADG